MLWGISGWMHQTFAMVISNENLLVEISGALEQKSHFLKSVFWENAKTCFENAQEYLRNGEC